LTNVSLNAILNHQHLQWKNNKITGYGSATMMGYRSLKTILGMKDNSWLCQTQQTGQVYPQLQLPETFWSVLMFRYNIKTDETLNWATFRIYSRPVVWHSINSCRVKCIGFCPGSAILTDCWKNKESSDLEMDEKDNSTYVNIYGLCCSHMALPDAIVLRSVTSPRDGLVLTSNSATDHSTSRQ
jgi:hypothetical protein